MYQVKEQDWKLFRQKLPLWQEAYMDKLNQEYIRLLSGEGPASEKFWGLEKRIRMDKKSVGVVADMRRSQMYSICFLCLSMKSSGRMIWMDSVKNWRKP